jgi:hypothetical protein
VWSADVPSWYTHDSGAITNPWPASVRTYARMLRRPPASSFAPVHRTAAAETVGA